MKKTDPKPKAQGTDKPQDKENSSPPQEQVKYPIPEEGLMLVSPAPAPPYYPKLRLVKPDKPTSPEPPLKTTKKTEP